MQYFKIVIMMHLQRAFYFNRFNLKISETILPLQNLSIKHFQSIMPIQSENSLLKELNLAIYEEALGLCCTKWHFSYCILIPVYLNPE